MMRRMVWLRLSAASGFWKTICNASSSAGLRLVATEARLSPLSSITPSGSGAVRPSSSFASVVLPLPDSPTRPRVSPGQMSSVMSRSA